MTGLSPSARAPLPLAVAPPGWLNRGYIEHAPYVPNVTKRYPHAWGSAPPGFPQGA